MPTPPPPEQTGGMGPTREENTDYRQEVEVRSCHAAGATAVDASHESKEAVEDTGDDHGDDAERDETI